jgi:hypothetical protein
MKIDIEEVEAAIIQAVESVELRNTIIENIRQRAQETAPEPREPDTSEKRNVVVLLCSREDLMELQDLSERITALAFQINADQNHDQIIDSIYHAGIAYNATKRRENLKVRNIAEACDTLSPKKHLSEFPKKIYTKEPAMVLVDVNRRIPLNAAQVPEGNE